MLRPGTITASGELSSVDTETVQHNVYDSIPTTARLSGSPEQVVARLRALIDDFAVTDMVNITQFRGYLTHEQVIRSMRLCTERVMPAFTPATASR